MRNHEDYEGDCQKTAGDLGPVQTEAKIVSIQSVPRYSSQWHNPCGQRTL